MWAMLLLDSVNTIFIGLQVMERVDVEQKMSIRFLN